MRIALVGFGAMGRLVFDRIDTKKHEVVAIIDPQSTSSLITSSVCDKTSLANAELVIEFARPEGLHDRVLVYKEARAHVIMATTGWYAEMQNIQHLWKGAQSSFLWSGNFSLGVHIFFSIVQRGAELLDQFHQYDVLIQELFHANKGDSPSGTALMLGEILKQNIKRKEAVVTERLDRNISPHEIHISSTRGGYIPGIHTVIFDSPADSIELTHRARNREGFAYGALHAAQWIMSKECGWYSIEDLMNELL